MGLTGRLSGTGVGYDLIDTPDEIRNRTHIAAHDQLTITESLVRIESTILSLAMLDNKGLAIRLLRTRLSRLTFVEREFVRL